MLELKLMCTKGHRSRGKWESSRGTPTPLLTCLPTGIETLSASHAQGKDETLQIANGGLQEGGNFVRGPGNARFRDGIRRS